MFFFGKNKLRNALRRGAVIIDVRTVHEYDQGRLRGSVHIPLERVAGSVERIRQMNKPVVCCASGDGRSGEAVRILKQNGLNEVFDGGNWEKLLKILNKE